MKKIQLTLLFFIIMVSCCHGVSSNPWTSDSSIVGGEVITVTFRFLNESNIPLNNKNTAVDLFLILGNRSPIRKRYAKSYVILPEKSFSFKFRQRIPEPFHGNAKYYFEVSSKDKRIYKSDTVDFSVLKNSFYYRSLAFLNKYSEELKSWKNFSDNPESHFKDGRILKKARTDIKKLLSVEETRNMLSTDDYHMLKVARHRIGFYLKYHPMPPETSAPVVKTETETESKKPEMIAEKPEHVESEILGDKPVKPEIDLKFYEHRKVPESEKKEVKKPEVEQPGKVVKKDKKDFFGTIFTILPGLSSEPDEGDTEKAPVDSKSTDKEPVSAAKEEEKEPEKPEDTDIPADSGTMTGELADTAKAGMDDTDVQTSGMTDETALSGESETGKGASKIKVKPLTGESKSPKLVKKKAKKKKGINLYLLFGGLAIVGLLVLRLLRKKKKQTPKSTRLDDDFF